MEEENQNLDEETRRMLMKNYFFVNRAEFPSYTARIIKWGYFFFGFGLFFILYFEKQLPTLVIGALSLLLGFIVFYKWITPYLDKKRLFDSRPTYEQMNNWLIKDLKNTTKPKAIEILSLDVTKLKPENFIIVPYPIYWNESGVDESQIHRRMGDDGKYSYSIWKVQILALTQHYISLFTCTYNWLENSILSENTNEFFYDDISSIKNDLIEFDHVLLGSEEEKAGTARLFQISNISGEKISVISDIPAMNISAPLGVNLDRIIQVLRIMLRNRRYGEVYEFEVENKKEDSESDNKADDIEESKEQNEDEKE